MIVLDFDQITQIYRDFITKHDLSIDDALLSEEAACVFHDVIEKIITLPVIDVPDGTYAKFCKDPAFVVVLNDRGEYLCDGKVLVSRQDRVYCRDLTVPDVGVHRAINLYRQFESFGEYGHVTCSKNLHKLCVALRTTAPEMAATINEATSLITLVGGIDGERHKQWTLDQVLRILTGVDYNDVIKDYEGEDEDGDPEYEWDTGKTP